MSALRICIACINSLSTIFLLLAVSEAIAHEKPGEPENPISPVAATSDAKCIWSTRATCSSGVRLCSAKDFARAGRTEGHRRTDKPPWWLFSPGRPRATPPRSSRSVGRATYRIVLSDVRQETRTLRSLVRPSLPWPWSSTRSTSASNARTRNSDYPRRKSRVRQYLWVIESDLKRTCKVNMVAMSTGRTLHPVPPEAALQSKSVLTQPVRHPFQWAAAIRQLDRTEPDHNPWR
jgi:hypothetical protein